MNSKQLIWIGFVLVAIITLALYFSPKPGKKEFEKQLEALRTVKSWKMDLQVSYNSRLVVRRTHEAQCPDMEHIYESGPENESEFIRTANLVYYRKNTRTWAQEAKTPPDLFLPILTPRPCMSNPGGTTTLPDSGDTEWRTELNRAIKVGTFAKGEMDRVDGVECRNWQVSWMNERSQLMAYTMCINEQDHLPRRIQMLRENVNMYFKWNVQVDVKAPEIGVPETGAPAGLLTATPLNSN